MNTNSSAPNIQLVESLVQVIQSLSANEQVLLLDKLLSEIPYPSITEMMHLAEQGKSFDFWRDEPDIYTLDDRESITGS
ncbi:MAG: hypothetical protein ACFE0J_03870 [Elainellaceae cyanobacterium]